MDAKQMLPSRWHKHGIGSLYVVVCGLDVISRGLDSHEYRRDGVKQREGESCTSTVFHCVTKSVVPAVRAYTYL